MQRREFLATLGVGASLPWASRAFGNAAASKPWKTAIGLNGFASSARKYNNAEMLSRIGVEHIGYVHLTDTDGTLRDGGTSKHLACGDGHANIATSLDTLYQGGFRGWVMIDGWEIPDVHDACVKGKRAIDAALARAGQS